MFASVGLVAGVCVDGCSDLGGAINNTGMERQCSDLVLAMIVFPIFQCFALVIFPLGLCVFVIL